MSGDQASSRGSGHRCAPPSLPARCVVSRLILSLVGPSGPFGRFGLFKPFGHFGCFVFFGCFVPFGSLDLLDLFRTHSQSPKKSQIYKRSKICKSSQTSKNNPKGPKGSKGPKGQKGQPFPKCPEIKQVAGAPAIAAHLLPCRPGVWFPG